MSKCRWVIAAMLMALPASAWACSCRMETIEEGLVSADHVFLAEVTSANPSSDENGEAIIAFDFVDAIVRKGGKIDFNKAISPLGDAACGVSLRVPAKHWFFTDKNGRFTSCSATLPADDQRAKILTESVWDKIVEQKRLRVQQLRHHNSE